MRLTLGVISDTHIPDRVRTLHPGVVPIFRDSGVTTILHAGDISHPRVLDELRSLAPVHAVRGNRDWLLMPPFSRQALHNNLELDFFGVRVLLTHGHGSLWQYLAGHLSYIKNGANDITRMTTRLSAQFPMADVIVFGHLHQAVNMRVGEQIFFNPGSPHFPDRGEFSPSIGLLRINANRQVEGHIIDLA